MTGTATRDWTTTVTSTSNTVAESASQDIQLDYVDHQISTQFGKQGTAYTGTKINFPAVTVSFSTF